MNKLSHLDNSGNAHMVDISDKAVTRRNAVSTGRIKMSANAFSAVTDGKVPKGDVFAAARIAGIMALKRTSELIPLCHPLPLTKCSIDFISEPETYSIKAVCSAQVDGKTGIEMETLTGVSVALLTIYDMCKAIDKSMVISDIMLESKTGGKSGEYRR
jgi:cyclic pyranopterin phosphate synthase